ncbi:hypothetical protein BGX31_010824 [Mortierella sp. GBA43]|nr:hypothetical protein BGX31_010824 [Mortierella sp. GBA43]
MFDHWCKQDSNSYGPEPQQEILIYSSQISLWSYSAKDPVTTIDIQTTRSRMIAAGWTEPKSPGMPIPSLDVRSFLPPGF